MNEGVTLLQLQCFNAVVTDGSFQAAADRLGRSQPSVSVAVKNLESQLQLKLLNREGYRVALTDAGRSFHQKTQVLLGELKSLRNHAVHLAAGEESDLRVVVGDLCPLPQTLRLLRQFFDSCPNTKLHLHFEAISGPWERLAENEADLILHHIDKAGTQFDSIDLFSVKLFPITRSISPDKMRDYVQCVIRDTAKQSEGRSYYVIEGARTWTVSDQLMKRELILQGMGWGHLPEYLIKQDLEARRLLTISGKYFKGGQVELAAARLRDKPHGPVAERLWNFISEEASGLAASAKEHQSPDRR
jgi:DNA-binding transcriptional LysR family regulator